MRPSLAEKCVIIKSLLCEKGGNLNLGNQRSGGFTFSSEQFGDSNAKRTEAVFGV